jgi:putative nucleotidyltransferase with HDIG domain
MARLERWQNWAASSTPSGYLDQLQYAGLLGQECGPVAALVGVKQDPTHHPEGCAFTHTAHVCDAMAAICARDRISGSDRVLYMMAALLHDVGKATTTRWHEQKQKWTAYGHDLAGVPVATDWLGRLGYGDEFVEQVGVLVELHMAHCRPPIQATAKSAKKLVAKLESVGLMWVDLFRLMEADCSGRPPLEAGIGETQRTFNMVVSAEFPGEAYDLTDWQPVRSGGPAATIDY